MNSNNNWESWKQKLAQAIQLGENMGMDQQEMVRKAEQVGDVLAEQVDPTNPEQRMLQELWQSGDDQEQQALASMIIKTVGGGNFR